MLLLLLDGLWVVFFLLLILLCETDP
uniref:Uncharacterized protein n=1 Tax=Arundo donax TaxID=35708 RepID=A0A0A9A007_ARUDO